MLFSVDEVNGVKIFRLKEDRLDSHIASELKAQLLVLLANDVQSVVVDLTETNYVDSSGLGALLLGIRQARENDSKFAVFGANKRILNLIKIAHLEGVIINYNSEKDALKASRK